MMARVCWHMGCLQVVYDEELAEGTALEHRTAEEHPGSQKVPQPDFSSGGLVPTSKNPYKRENS